MKRLGWKQWVLVAALALVVLATGLFAVRIVRRAIYWHAHRDEAIRPWMTIPYVAHSYRLPPHILYQALGIPQQLHDRRPLGQIAREQNRSVDEVISLLQETIGRERAIQSAGAPPSEPARSP